MLHSYSFSIPSSFILSISSDNYSKWKKARNDIISSFGSRILAYTEDELSQFYNSVEAEIHKRINSNDPHQQMVCLFLISILHYYRRSYNQLKEYFDFIKKMAMCSNRNVCKGAARLMRWLGEESTDNITFLREMVDAANDWLQINMELYSFNTLIVLYQIGKLMPLDILNVTMPRSQEIWNAICSQDKELRLIAIKVLNIHLRNLPSHFVQTDAEKLFQDAKEEFQNSTQNLHGPILVFKLLLKIFPEIISKNVEIIVSFIFIVLITPVPDQADDAFDFLFMLIKENPKIVNDEIQTTIFSCLKTQITSSNKTSILFKYFNKFIAIIPHESIPKSIIVSTMSQIIVDKCYSDLYDNAFDVLVKLMHLFPDLTLPETIFSKVIPCYGFIKALKLQLNYLSNLKSELVSYYKRGLEENASKETICFSIYIVKKFKSFLFSDMSKVFNEISSFEFHPDDSIRLLLAATLKVFLDVEATKELINLAVYDTSKKVRIMAIKKLKQSKEFPACSQKLAQLLKVGS